MSDIRFSEASLEIQALFYSTSHPTRSVTHVNVKNTLCSLCETQKKHIQVSFTTLFSGPTTSDRFTIIYLVDAKQDNATTAFLAVV